MPWGSRRVAVQTRCKGEPMKKRLTLGALATALLVCLTLVLGACSSPEPDKYVVYDTKPSMLYDVGDSMKYYQVVIYRETGEEDEIEIIKHKNDLLTGMADEVHLMKSDFSGEDAQELADSFYEGVVFDAIECASKSITDEGDYYCILFLFKDLDKAANVKDLVDAGVLTSNDDSEESSGRVSAGTVMQSIALSMGTTELSEEEAAALELHFNQQAE